MEEEIVVTKKILAKAFLKWNESIVRDPGNFMEIDSSEEMATQQAEVLMSLIKNDK